MTPPGFAANAKRAGNNAIKPGLAASSPPARGSSVVIAAQAMITKGL